MLSVFESIWAYVRSSVVLAKHRWLPHFAVDCWCGISNWRLIGLPLNEDATAAQILQFVPDKTTAEAALRVEMREKHPRQDLCSALRDRIRTTPA